MVDRDDNVNSFYTNTDVLGSTITSDIFIIF